MNRRKFMQQSSLATAGLMLGKYAHAYSGNDFPLVRIPVSQRKFNSPAVEQLIATIKKNTGK